MVQEEVDGLLGEALVIYEHVDYGIVDHNTISNIAMDAIWYRGQNNIQFTNNLLYNNKAYGQSTYDVSGWGVWWKGGVGQMALRKAGLVDPNGFLDITPAVLEITGGDTLEDCTVTPFDTTIVTPADTTIYNDGTYIMSDGQVVDMMNRNINWHNNAAVWSPAMTSWVDDLAASPWSWTVETVTPDSVSITPATYDTVQAAYPDCGLTITELTPADTVTFPGTGGTTTTTVWDTMLTSAQSLVWADDSTLATINSGVGVTSVNNAVLTAADLGMQLDEQYIIHQLARTLDFRDDQTTQGVGADNNWIYEPDNNMANIEWPLHYDGSYSATSTAATHSTTGGPIGSNRWMDFTLPALSTDNTLSSNVPNAFTLKQNYPNPFNPTTEIEFSLDKMSNVNLTIFNVLGQKVKTLVNGTKALGTHKYSWNGLDEMGNSVSTGIYFYTLTSENVSVTKKMAFMK